MEAQSRTYEGLCPRCGKWFENLNERTVWCRKCTFPLLYTTDRPERIMNRVSELRAEGMTREAAQKQAYSEGKPNCIICGVQISYAKVGAILCGTNPECKRVRNRISYLTLKLGMSKEEAVAKAKEEHADRS